MSDARNRVRDRIVKELDEVGGWLASLRNEVCPREMDAGGDNTPLSEVADATQVIEERETGMQLLDWLAERSVGLRNALRRIDGGTYGVCEACDEFIRPERLRALPEATLCVGCQSRLESSHVAHPAPQRAYSKTAVV